ncbi:MAG: DUF2325 domain-containing protein [Coriobacteriales bacterium]
MSVVIVGGNKRMQRNYNDICKKYGCSCKCFIEPGSDVARRIGSPDLLVLFTNTVSHQLVRCALCRARKCKTCVERCHTSSATALEDILQRRCVRKDA